MTLKVGDNLLDGKLVVVTLDEASGNTDVVFPFWVDPVSQGPFTVTYSPGTTLAFVETQVVAVLRGEVPPFVGL